VLAERLEVLKQRLVEAVVTEEFVDSTPPAPPAPAKVLQSQQDGRQWRLLVRDLDDDTMSLWREREPNMEISVRHPSLEEILVACLKDTACNNWSDGAVLEADAQREEAVR
jgi:hypothetical protein